MIRNRIWKFNQPLCAVVNPFTLLHWAYVNCGNPRNLLCGELKGAIAGGRDAGTISCIKHQPELSFCWEVAEADTPVWNVKCGDERLRREASGQCRVRQMELQTAPSSASRGYRHKSKSTLPVPAVWKRLATCHTSVSSTRAPHVESNYR